MSDRTALYAFYGDDRALLYVGISGDPDGRQRQHARDAAHTWYPLVAQRTVTWFDSRREAEAAERTAISVGRPLYNMAHSKHWTAEKWAAHRARQQKKHGPGPTTEHIPGVSAAVVDRFARFYRH